ncbi:GNAT family N-acetyltransferase [Candidatus Bipolaricaulota bacterium]|nr:GNAT family N-acetyltransferase [Candidatus Bipolaricaulota bacterium]
MPPGQEKMVAPNAVSIAQAHFNEKAWFRGIYADDTPVGFVMLYDDPDTPQYFLWRLMIAGPQQGKGYGRKAMERLIEYVRGRPGATELKASYMPIPGGPWPFYQSLGFEPTGEMEGDEVVIRLRL